MATSAFLFLDRTVVSLGASGATYCGSWSSLQQQQHSKKTQACKLSASSGINLGEAGKTCLIPLCCGELTGVTRMAKAPMQLNFSFCRHRLWLTRLNTFERPNSPVFPHYIQAAACPFWSKPVSKRCRYKFSGFIFYYLNLGLEWTHWFTPNPHTRSSLLLTKPSSSSFALARPNGKCARCSSRNKVPHEARKLVKFGSHAHTRPK